MSLFNRIVGGTRGYFHGTMPFPFAKPAQTPTVEGLHSPSPVSLLKGPFTPIASTDSIGHSALRAPSRDYPRE